MPRVDDAPDSPVKTTALPARRGPAAPYAPLLPILTLPGANALEFDGQSVAVVGPVMLLLFLVLAVALVLKLVGSRQWCYTCASPTCPGANGDLANCAHWDRSGGRVDEGVLLDLQQQLLFANDSQVFVGIPNSSTIAVSVWRDTTVRELKVKIHEQAGWPVHLQRLLFASKQLEDDRTMADYEITHGATLHLAGRLPGGMYADGGRRLGEVTRQLEAVYTTSSGRRCVVPTRLDDTIHSIFNTLSTLSTPHTTYRRIGVYSKKTPRIRP
eukprot:COSAG01_NODE_5612_length_4145_cov_11.062531_5_plen_270_part_00